MSHFLLYGKPFVAGGETDPFWADVISLLHFDGADASTSFIDETGKAWGGAGSPVLTTADKLFGSASGDFPGTDGFIIETNAAADWNLVSDEFTIELAVKYSALPTSGDAASFISKWQAGTLSWWFYSFNNSGTMQLYFNYSTDGTAQSSVSVDWPGATTGIWYRLAVVRSGNDIKFFVEGSQLGTDQSIGAVSFADTTATVEVGGNNNEYGLTALVDELRVTRAARYTSNYTVASGPFPDA